MPIAKSEIKGVISYGRDAHALDGGGDAAVTDLAFAGKLIHTIGAHAILPQVPGRIGTEMTIIPGDIGLLRIDSLHARWSYIVHRISLHIQIGIAGLSY